MDGKEDKEEEEIEDERNDIVVRKKDKVHSLGGYFTKRCHFLGKREKERYVGNLRNSLNLFVFRE